MILAIPRVMKLFFCTTLSPHHRACMNTRRQFLALSAAALASAAVPIHLLAQASDRLGPPPFSNAALGAGQQGQLTAANFEKLVGSSFHAFLDNKVVAEIVLRKVKIPTYPSASPTASPTGAPSRTSLIASRRAAVTTKCFMLIFGTGPTFIPQDTYVLDSGILGSFSALLVPAQSLPGNQIAIATFTTL
jgi:hypothetical protein